MSRRVVKAVLDSSAVVAYAHGRISVGEVLVEVTDEGAAFALPDACVIDEAAALDADRLSAAQAMLAAVDHGAYLLTRRPHLYGEDAAPIIEV